MIFRGAFRHPFHNRFICAAHTNADIDYTLETAGEVFPRFLQEIKNNGRVISLSPVLYFLIADINPAPV